jgi:acetyl-CoA acetyltransferase family protein
MNAVYVAGALRSPVGRFGGAFAEVRPDDLAAETIRCLMEHCDLEPEAVDDVILGNANGAGEENRNVARMASLLAGLGVGIPGATVNRLCGSGLEAVIQARRAIACGDAGLVVAGGVESMTRAPWVALKPDRPYHRGELRLEPTNIGWRLVNPRMSPDWTIPLGEGAELLARRYEISRESQDAFAFESHEKAAKAWETGRFPSEVVGTDELGLGEPLTRDETIRDNVTLQRLAGLPPAFLTDGSVTAGNSSPLSDGASALLLAGDDALARYNLEPLCRIVASGSSALEPQLYGLGPVEASAAALDRSGVGWADLDVVELNEAYAAQSLACLAQWPDLDPARVNPNGGAIALGHPLGSSGARLVISLVHELRRRGGGMGLATLCIGVGQGLAVLVEA